MVSTAFLADMHDFMQQEIDEDIEVLDERMRLASEEKKELKRKIDEDIEILDEKIRLTTEEKKELELKKNRKKIQFALELLNRGGISLEYIQPHFNGWIVVWISNKEFLDGLILVVNDLLMTISGVCIPFPKDLYYVKLDSDPAILRRESAKSSKQK